MRQTHLGALYVVVQVVPEGVDEVDGVVSGIGIGVTWEQDWRGESGGDQRGVSYCAVGRHRGGKGGLSLPKVMYPMLSPTAASVSLSSSGGSRWLNSTWGAVWLARRPSLNSCSDGRESGRQNIFFIFLNPTGTPPPGAPA